MGDALHTHGGVTDAREARLAQAGLIAVQGPTILDARTGVMAGPGSRTLLTGTAATAPMSVAIAPHQWVTTRGSANGPYLGVLEGSTTVSIGAAPGSGTRTDVVYVKQGDATAGVPTPDGTTAPVYGVLAGAVGAGKPNLVTVAGAEELGTVAVSAGATSTNGAGVTITNTARQTAARGATVIVKDAAELALLTGYDTQRALVLSTGQEVMWRGGGWKGTRTLAYSAAPHPGTGGGLTAANNTFRQIDIPDLGYPYRVLVSGMVWALVSPGSKWNFLARIDNNSSGELVRPVGELTSTTYAPVSIQAGLSGVLTGAHSVLFVATRITGSAGDGFQPTTESSVQSYTVQVIPE